MLNKLYRSINTFRKSLGKGKADQSTSAFNVVTRLNYELYSAVNEGNFTLTANLIERGANVNFNYPAKITRSPLFAAFQNNNVAIARLLIEKGAEINLKNERANNWLWVNIFDRKD